MATLQEMTEALKELRAHGYTLNEIAGKCGCTHAAISYIISGKISNPRRKIREGIVAMHAELKKLEESQ